MELKKYTVVREANGIKSYEEITAFSEWLAALDCATGELKYLGGNGSQGFYSDDRGTFAVTFRR